MTPSEIETMRQLIEKTETQNPEPSDLLELRAFLEQTPELWRAIGSYATDAQNALVSYASSQPIVQESIRLTAAELYQSLLLPTDTALEKLAISQVVAAHILHTTIQSRYINAAQNRTSLIAADFWERRLDSSLRRYLRALEALARLRRLALPPVQINIAHTQTNLTPGASTPPSAADPP